MSLTHAAMPSGRLCSNSTVVVVVVLFACFLACSLVGFFWGGWGGLWVVFARSSHVANKHSTLQEARSGLFPKQTACVSLRPIPSNSPWFPVRFANLLSRVRSGRMPFLKTSS